jgi:hypothetical protein
MISFDNNQHQAWRLTTEAFIVKNARSNRNENSSVIKARIHKRRRNGGRKPIDAELDDRAQAK